jgi:hypothetical protein
VTRPGPVVGTDECGCLIYQIGSRGENRTSHQAYCPIGQAEREREMANYDPSPTGHGLGLVLLFLAAMTVLCLGACGVMLLAVVA